MSVKENKKNIYNLWLENNQHNVYVKESNPEQKSEKNYMKLFIFKSLNYMSVRNELLPLYRTLYTVIR